MYARPRVGALAHVCTCGTSHVFPIFFETGSLQDLFSVRPYTASLFRITRSGLSQQYSMSLVPISVLAGFLLPWPKQQLGEKGVYFHLLLPSWEEVWAGTWRQELRQRFAQLALLHKAGVPAQGWCEWAEPSHINHSPGKRPSRMPTGNLLRHFLCWAAPHIHGCWGSKLSSSDLHSKHFPQWAISPVLLLPFNQQHRTTSSM